MKTKIILVSAKLQSGKNTFANILQDVLEKDHGKRVCCDSFAAKLKKNCTEDFSAVVSFLRSEYNRLVSEGVKDIEWMNVTEDNFYENKTDLTRLLLQAYGTEIFRKRVDDFYWIKDFEERINNSLDEYVIVTDVRFKNEIEYFYSKFYGDPNYKISPITVRIERDSDRTNIQNQHISEKDLDDYSCWDVVVDNNGTMEELADAAYEVAGLIVKEEIGV